MSGLGKSSASIQREREALPVSEKKRKERRRKKKYGCFETKTGAILYFIESLPGSGFNSSRVKKDFFFFPLKTKGGARVKLNLKQHPCQFCSVLGTRQGRNTSVEERGGCRYRRQGTIYDTTCM